MCLLDEILGRLESVGLFVAAHKCTFFARELVWCRKAYSDGVVSHDPASIHGLSDMCRPQTAGEFIQFLQVANWLRTSLPRMVREVARALKSILSEHRKQVAEWVDVLPAAQWALNKSFRERCRDTPYCVMFGRAPRTSFSALKTVTGGVWNFL